MAGVKAGSATPFLFDASDFASVEDLLRCFRAAVTRGEEPFLAMRCKLGQVKLHFKPTAKSAEQRRVLPGGEPTGPPVARAPRAPGGGGGPALAASGGRRDEPPRGLLPRRLPMTLPQLPLLRSMLPRRLPPMLLWLPLLRRMLPRRWLLPRWLMVLVLPRRRPAPSAPSATAL